MEGITMCGEYTKTLINICQSIIILLYEATCFELFKRSSSDCCIQVEKVSWMLLSEVAKLEPRSGLRGEGSLL